MRTSVQQLNDENNKLKSELDTLKAEVGDLKQTDQYLFSKAKEYYDAYKAGDSKTSNSDLRGAKELIDKLLTRFPNSPFKAQATELSKILNTAVAIIDKIEKSAAEIESAVLNKEFGKAFATLHSIKPYISDETYNTLAKKIDDEQNKPIALTVLALTVEREKYAGRKVAISGYMFQNWHTSNQFSIVDNCYNRDDPNVYVNYGTLPVDVRKALLTSDPGSCNHHIPITVVGILNSNYEIEAIKVSF